MMLVRIEKPGDVTLAEWFVELRSWFDNNECSPTLFSPAGQVINRTFFNITFADDAQGRRFASRFAKYAPSVADFGETAEVKASQIPRLT